MKNKVWRRGVPFSAVVAPLVSRMEAVDEYRENLLRLHTTWDSMALLGQMSDTVTDIDGTRSAFQTLSAELLDSLARRLLAGALRSMRGKAQVAIDILVRNLFERTADVGFLALDDALAQFLAQRDDPAARAAIESRFRDYVAKYSVYDDIVVLAGDGRVLARLDRSITVDACSDSLVSRALRGDAAYVEQYGPTDVLGGRCGLIYAKAIPAQQGSRGGAAGVLCLSFRFEDEMRGVFRQLLAPGDASVITLVDGAGRIVASSDPWQLPIDAPLPPADDDAATIRFAGRDYLSVTVQATSYEGYRGPGWAGSVLLPVDQAFTLDAAGDANTALDELAHTLATADLFDDELRGIPRQARHIQRELARSLWNGTLRSTRTAAAASASQATAPSSGSANFATTLLREVSQTGERLRQVFERAIGDLHRSALSHVFDDARFHARLAIDIMDRNLYERANDCRWWALNGVLQRCLEAPGDATLAAEAGAVLKHINGLYTVYSLLALFDREGRIVAVSDPAEAHRVGQRLDNAWMPATLQLRDAERHAVSRHEPTPLYADRATYVYAAALRASSNASGAVTGGIAIVFDGEPQFAAMLRDALPIGADGRPLAKAVGLMVTRSGRVVASTDSRWPAGSASPLPPATLALKRGAAATLVADIEGVACAAGVSMAQGYREYGSRQADAPEDVAAVMLIPLGERVAAQATPPSPFVPLALPAAARADALQIAAFRVGEHWLGIAAERIDAALAQARITALPNAPVSVLGLVTHGNRLVTTVDLGRLRYGGPATASDGPVVVIRGAQERRLALRVDELGPVFPAARASIQALKAGNDRRAGSLDVERLVSGADGCMLVVIGADALIAAVDPAAMAGTVCDAELSSEPA